MVQYYPYHMNNNIFFIRSIFYNYSTGLPRSRFSMHGMGMSWSWHAWHGPIDAHRIAARRARSRRSEFRTRDYGSAGEKIGNRKKPPNRKSGLVVPNHFRFLSEPPGPYSSAGDSVAGSADQDLSSEDYSELIEDSTSQLGASGTAPGATTF